MILDVALPEGAKGRPLTGPSWTQVPEEKQDLTPEPEQPNNKSGKDWDYRNADPTIGGSFSEMRAAHEGYLAKKAEEE